MIREPGIDYFDAFQTAHDAAAMWRSGIRAALGVGDEVTLPECQILIERLRQHGPPARAGMDIDAWYAAARSVLVAEDYAAGLRSARARLTGNLTDFQRLEPLEDADREKIRQIDALLAAHAALETHLCATPAERAVQHSAAAQAPAMFERFLAEAAPRQ